MRWGVTFDVRVDSGIKLEPAFASSSQEGTITAIHGNQDLKQGRKPQFFNVPMNRAEPARVPVIAGDS